MSKGFESFWRAECLDDLLEDVVLQARLNSIISAPLVHKEGCLLLEPLIQRSTSPENFSDCTGFEAFTNKIHIDDFIDNETEDTGELIRQGVKAAFVLAKRLEKHGKYRVLLSLDPDLPTISLRFFMHRLDEQWGAEDPNEFKLEEVLMIDTGCGLSDEASS